MPRVPLVAYRPTPTSGYYYYTTNTDLSPHKEKFLLGFFIAILVVLILLVCCCIRFFSRSGRQVCNSTATVAAPASATSADESSMNHGCSSNALASLPVFVFHSTSHEGNRECVVCLMDFRMGEKCRFLPQCGHSFHVGCVDMWLHSHSTCPLCRSSVQIQHSELSV